jgi:hypothetical protein
MFDAYDISKVLLHPRAAVVIMTHRQSIHLEYGDRISETHLLSAVGKSLTFNMEIITVTKMFGSAACLYRISQEERSVFGEVIVSVILSKKKVYMCTR